MRNLRNMHERKLRQRTKRRERNRLKHATVASRVNPKKDVARDDARTAFRDNAAMIEAIGMDPKYLNAHARRREPSTGDYTKLRDSWLRARDNAAREKRIAEDKAAGKTTFVAARK